MLTKESVRSLFDYREDGNLLWKPRDDSPHFTGKFAGKLVGSIDKAGRRVTTVDGKDYFVHRLIFLYHHGYLPRAVDHIDRNKLNNQIDNLRPATYQQNLSNRSLSKRNKSGHTGVYKTRSGKYLTQIMYRGGIIKIGLMDDYNLACASYRAASSLLRREFCPYK